MTTYSNPHEKIENQLIGNILDENAPEFFDLRMEMGKSISAPPTHFAEALTSPSPNFYQGRPVEGFSPNHQVNYNNAHLSPNLAPQKHKWSHDYYELNNYDAFQTLQQQAPEVVDPSSNMYGNSLNNGPRPFPQRPHSQSLHYHDHQTYGYPGNPNPYLEARNKQGQGMSTTAARQPIPQDLSGRFQPNGEPNMPYNNQFNMSHSQPIQMPQDNPYGQNYYNGPQQFLGNNNNNINQFQTVMRKSSADPSFYNQKSPIRAQVSFQQIQRSPENGQPFYAMNTFQSQGQHPNFMNNQNNQVKQGFKGFGPKRMNSASTVSTSQSSITSESPSFYPLGFQPESASPHADNNFMNGFANGYPSSPTRAGTPINMKYILANFMDACKDQNGSRIIQQYFEKADREDKEKLFQQILANSNALLADMFGNYVIQKILELGSIQQKLKIFDLLKGRIFMLSQHTYSCRVIQKALEEFKNNGPVQDEIIKELSVDIVCLVEDQNGNHVIQKCVETLPAEKLGLIIDKVTEKLEKLPFHAFGCRVIQRVLEYSTFEQTAPLLKKIMAKCLECCESQYGNYIMQHILEKGPHSEKDTLLDVLKNNFVRLSLNKFASNVVEKSAIHANGEFRQHVIEVLITSHHESKLSLIVLMNHPFGNYVVQRLFECSDKSLRRKIYEVITKQENLDDAKRTNYGKHVSAFIEKLMEIQKD